MNEYEYIGKIFGNGYDIDKLKEMIKEDIDCKYTISNKQKPMIYKLTETDIFFQNCREIFSDDLQ